MPLYLRLRAKKQWRDWTVMALLAAQVPMLGRARVTFTRFSPSGRPPDDDNLASSCKSARDALIGAHVIPDDGAEYLRATYCHEHCGRDGARLELMIEEWR